MVELNSQPKHGFNSLETVKSPMSKVIKCKWSYLFAIQHRPSVELVQCKNNKVNALISGHPGGLTLGNPQAFAPRHLQIPPTQGQYSSTKTYHCPSPGSII